MRRPDDRPINACTECNAAHQAAGVRCGFDSAEYIANGCETGRPPTVRPHNRWLAYEPICHWRWRSLRHSLCLRLGQCLIRTALWGFPIGRSRMALISMPRCRKKTCRTGRSQPCNQLCCKPCFRLCWRTVMQIAIHRETKESMVYLLVLEKNGPTFKESDPTRQFASRHDASRRWVRRRLEEHCQPVQHFHEYVGGCVVWDGKDGTAHPGQDRSYGPLRHRDPKVRAGRRRRRSCFRSQRNGILRRRSARPETAARQVDRRGAGGRPHRAANSELTLALFQALLQVPLTAF